MVKSLLVCCTVLLFANAVFAEEPDVAALRASEATALKLQGERDSALVALEKAKEELDALKNAPAKIPEAVLRSVIEKDKQIAEFKTANQILTDKVKVMEASREEVIRIAKRISELK